jgi:hypothetical protein
MGRVSTSRDIIACEHRRERPLGDMQTLVRPPKVQLLADREEVAEVAELDVRRERGHVRTSQVALTL